MSVLGIAVVASLVSAPVFEVSYPRDVWIAAGSVVAGALFTLVPVPEHAPPWEQQLAPFDEAVFDNFSARAATASDALLLLTVAMPLALELGDGLNPAYAKRALIYGQALGITFALNTAVKFLVQRPRPYTYNASGLVQAYQRSQGVDAYLSFYSGHAATSFAAAVSGAYLFAARSKDVGARSLVWAAELSLATATANLRVRAGKHFYSDVMVGALMGAAAGWMVPWLHQDASMRYQVTAREAWSMVAGVAGGALLSELAPVGENIIVPLASSGGLGVAFTATW